MNRRAHGSILLLGHWLSIARTILLDTSLPQITWSGGSNFTCVSDGNPILGPWLRHYDRSLSYISSCVNFFPLLIRS